MKKEGTDMKKWHLWLAASIGLVVIAGMMIREFDVDVLSSIDLSPGDRKSVV